MATAFGMSCSILRPSLKRLAGLAVLLLTVACSDSGTKGTFTPPPLIQPVEFSFITDGALFGFFESPDGEYSTQELLRPASGLMIILDTDQSRDASISDTISYLRRSATPEYAVYAENDVLYAYELETQHSHTLFDFRSEKVSRPGSICDIQPVVSVDEDNFNDDRIVFVDMEAAYVRISYTDCSSTTVEDFAHYRVEFVEDDDREYAIRVEESADNEDDPTATRIVTKRFSELRGRRLPVDRALMYARVPVVDIAKDRVGYLGFNPDTLTWSFYVSDIDYSITRRIWQLTDSTFAAQSEQQSRGAFPDSTFTPETRQANFMYLANNEIGLRYGNAIVKWTMDDVFDDDRSTERVNGLSNPVYTFMNESIYEGETRPQSDGSWVIGDGPLIIVIAANGTAQTIKNLSHETIDSYQLFTTRSEVGLAKAYTDGTYAVTLISKAGGNETTIIGRTLNNVRLTPQSTNNDIHIATASLPSEQANIRAR
ncbi:MAG: hypothetical protein R3183_13445, partial [Oleiphilaceae bacterium]|nr:hypothetical protein [Oleiphilaceae bacterium]